MSVWSRDAITGAMQWQEVEAQSSNHYDATVYVTIRNISTHKQQVITSNRIHPFFVQTTRPVLQSSEGHDYQGVLANGHWIDAEHLQPGDRLLAADTSWAEVVAVRLKNTPIQAYNLTVAGVHTYFITEKPTAKPVWVHNNCWDELPFGAKPTGQKNQYGQDTFTGANGETIYKGRDGKYYDAKIYPPTPLTNSQAFSLIDKFRSGKSGMLELGDHIPVKGDDYGTVAFIELNGRPVFGVNSSVLVRDADKNLGRY